MIHMIWCVVHWHCFGPHYTNIVNERCCGHGGRLNAGGSLRSIALLQENLPIYRWVDGTRGRRGLEVKGSGLADAKQLL